MQFLCINLLAVKHSSASLQTCPELLRSVVACLAQISIYLLLFACVSTHTLHQRFITNSNSPKISMSL